MKPAGCWNLYHPDPDHDGLTEPYPKVAELSQNPSSLDEYYEF